MLEPSRCRRALATAVLVVASSLLLLSGVEAQNAVIAVEPADVAIAPGNTVELALLARDVQGLYGIDLRLTFDPNLLEVVDADPGKDGLQLIKGDFPFPDYVIREKISNVDGTVWYAVTQVAPREPASGTGTVLRLTFRAKTTGVSPVDILFVRIVDDRGVSIASASQGGQVVIATGQGATPVASSPTPTGAPTETATAQPEPTSTWTATAEAQPTALETSPAPTAEITPSVTPTTLAASATPFGAYPAPLQDTPTPRPTFTPQPSPTAAAASTATQAPATRTATPARSPTPTASSTIRPRETATPELTAAPATPTDEPIHPAAPTATLVGVTAIRPLIPRRVFAALVVALALFSMLLFLYLVRREKR